MKRAAITGLAIASLLTGPLGAQTLDEQEAHDIGLDAYLYLYPLITMDLTRKQSTNIEAGKEPGKGPANTFINIPTYPTADMRAVVRPNFDTLYSVAWLDLTKEPMIVSVPDTGDRYYLMPMLDMWTDVFASPGTRTTGNRAGRFLIASPDWNATAQTPPDLQIIKAPTPHVWVIGRTKTDGPEDYAAVHKIQAGYAITPLSQWGKPAQRAEVKIDASVDMTTPPKVQMDRMSTERLLAYGAELLNAIPPHATDQPIITRLKKIGIEPGKPFKISALDAKVQKALESGAADAQQLMRTKMPTIARVANGWSMNTDTMGVYGNYYLKRAIVANAGLGANVPEDAVYPLNLADSAGRPLEGAHRYTIHFDRASMPPVNAFWSVTLYDSDGFQVANPLNRFAVSSWMPFKYNKDGSLDLLIQNEPPGAGAEANWLPAPKGPFNLTMRLYSPRPDVLTGQWNPPAVTRTDNASALAQ